MSTNPTVIGQSKRLPPGSTRSHEAGAGTASRSIDGLNVGSTPAPGSCSVEVSALFVATGGVYFGLDGVDPWDITRDARKYAGPYPVVAHPPCERWGRYWGGGPSARVKRVLGADDGCFVSALWSVRRYGGILEHPEASHAWAHFGLNKPPKSGGWIVADNMGGWTCCVEQGHYGHTARKATWLYANDVTLPELIWGACTDRQRLDEGFHSKAERDAARAAGQKPRKRLSTRENLSTPIAFRDVLLGVARSYYRELAA